MAGWKEGEGNLLGEEVKNVGVRRINQENMENSENPPKDTVREDSGKMLSNFFISY